MRKNPAKYFLKQGLQTISALLGPHNKTPSSPQLLILMYHRVLPQNDPRALKEEPGMMITPESFRAQLQILKQHFEIVSYSQWIESKQKSEKLPLKSCVITFDDGWADNYEFAFPLLQEYSAPATVYLVSDMVGTNQSFWPERLANLIIAISCMGGRHWKDPKLDWILKAKTSYQFNGKIPDQEEIAQIISHAKEYTDRDIHSRLGDIENNLGMPISSCAPDLLSWDQVDEMVDSGLVEFGSHTCSHLRLHTDTEDELLEHEIINSKQVIEKHTGHAVKTFCYPNGDYSTRALELVRENYDSAVTTLGGWNSLNSDDHLLRRIAIHEDITSTKTAFLARISGWM